MGERPDLTESERKSEGESKGTEQGVEETEGSKVFVGSK
jgi:hypothetical protein